MILIGFIILVTLCVLGCLYCLCKSKFNQQSSNVQTSQSADRPSNTGLKQKDDSMDDIEMSCSEDGHARVDKHIFKTQSAFDDQPRVMAYRASEHEKDKAEQ